MYRAPLKTLKNINEIEAVKSPQSPLHVPNLHIVIQKAHNDEKIWVGQCLDLSISAYSNKKSKKDICREIFEDITEMAIHMILYHLHNGTVENLLQFSAQNHGKWQIFNTYNNIKKINDLKKSYHHLISHSPELHLPEEPLGTKLNEENINALINTMRAYLNSTIIYKLEAS